MTAPFVPAHITQVRDGQIHCPLCDWSAPIPKAQYAPGVAAVFGMSAAALADIHLMQDARRLEINVETHLRTHTVTEWVTALMQARDRVAELEERAS